mmetsp:Transcript_4677/g.12803  ORF Transcript_4677/g.12803 Transcript_4677/m.12803 type:complete len:363 (-) Transcript_4677:916-2004(-)
MGGALQDEGTAVQKSTSLQRAVAGSLSGCVARFIIGPLDVIKIRFQVQLEPIKSAQSAAARHAASKYTGLGQALVTILKEEGIQGLWRGTVPGLLLTVPYTGVQFVALQHAKDTAAKLGLSGNPGWAPIVSLGSGAFAGAAGTIASYPFDLIRTTLAAQGEPKVYKNMFDAAVGITKGKGVRGLYSGLGVTMVEIMPYAALQFGLYDALQSAWKSAQVHYQQRVKGANDSQPSDTRAVNFTCGLLAGLFAKLATHPLDVAKKRYQVAGLQRSLKYGARVDSQFAMKTLQAGIVDIYKREGLSGLWKGSMPSIAKAAPSAAITFSVYEAIIGWMAADELRRANISRSSSSSSSPGTSNSSSQQ